MMADSNRLSRTTRLLAVIAIVVCGVLLASQLQATAAPPKKQDLR